MRESAADVVAAAEDAQQLFEPSFCLPLKGQDTFRERERARERTSGKRYFLANRKESAAAKCRWTLAGKRRKALPNKVSEQWQGIDVSLCYVCKSRVRYLQLECKHLIGKQVKEEKLSRG